MLDTLNCIGVPETNKCYNINTIAPRDLFTWIVCIFIT